MHPLSKLRLVIKLFLYLIGGQQFLLLGCVSDTISQPLVHSSCDSIISIEIENYVNAEGWCTKSYYTGIGMTTDFKDDQSGGFLLYAIQFDQPGVYQVYTLGNRKRNTPVEDNIIQFVLSDENNHEISTALSGFLPVNAPVWSSLCGSESGEKCYLTLPESGKYFLKVSAHKGKGFYLDKIVLTSNPGFYPSGTGPEETFQGGSPEGKRSRIVLPPQWAFGVLYGGYTDQDQTIQVVDSLINGDYPIDAYWIDSWFWNYNNGNGPKGYIDFIGDTTAFPDVGKLWDELQVRNIKAGIWIWNQIHETGNETVYEEFRKRNFFSNEYFNTNGWHNELNGTKTGQVDFENPEAVTYWKQKLKPFFEKGLDFLKLDNSSSIPFCKAAFTVTQEFGKETSGRGFILAHLHSTYEYEHKLYPTKWTGDAKIAWSQPDYPDMSQYAMGGLKENILMVSDPKRSTYEVPFLSHDAGGYNYFGSNDQSEELYIRWIQFASMNSIMMIFSTNDNPTRNHPYRYPEQVQENFRKYTHLRMQLFPYIYSYALKTHLTGRKMIQGDIQHECQYLLGDEILVAPVCEKGARTRTLYLPEGEWIDPELGKVYQGGQDITVDAPLDKLPLLIRAGSVIPMRNYARSVELGNNDTLTLEIYPSGEETGFELLEDDGISNEYLDRQYSSTSFTLQKHESSVQFTIQPVSGSFKGMKETRFYRLHFNLSARPDFVKINGQKVTNRVKYHSGRQVIELSLSVSKSEPQTIIIGY